MIGTTVLGAHDICSGATVTSHPSVKDKLTDKYTYSEERVVVHGNILTSRGPGNGYGYCLTSCTLLGLCSL